MIVGAVALVRRSLLKSRSSGPEHSAFFWACLRHCYPKFRSVSGAAELGAMPYFAQKDPLPRNIVAVCSDKPRLAEESSLISGPRGQDHGYSDCSTRSARLCRLEEDI